MLTLQQVKTGPCQPGDPPPVRTSSYYMNCSVRADLPMLMCKD